MNQSDNATLFFIPSSLQPDNYTLPPNASSPSPGPDFSGAPTPSAGPSPGLSLAPGPSVSFSPGPTPTPGPTTSGFAGGAGSLGASPFPRPWVPHEPPFWDTPLNHGLNVFVGAALCITMLGLGCTVDVNHFGAHVRRPVGALLAALCQFGFLPLLAFLLALVFSLDEVAAVAVLLCGCCPGGNLSNLMSLLVDGDMNLSIIMTISSTLLALVLMPLCVWIYSRAWINTPLVQLLPLGAITLTLCSTLIPIGLGVFIRYKYNRVADYIVKVSLWSLLVTLVVLFIMTGTMLGPELLASIPATVYMVAIVMPLAGYASGYGLATLFHLPPNCKRTVCLETGSQNVQLCTAILKLAFPPRFIGSMYMFPLLYALFQSAEAGIFVLLYKMYGSEILHKRDPLDEDEDTDISYKKLKEEEMADTSYGTVKADNLIMMETTQTAL
ncbi:solute carrier family 10 member 4 [Phyllostomus discolor]|uniref:Sodium/bile acid cotransporter 4 n=1 Tax=Phyllostomus discolor TaxID=89673 RepID=A0A6J2L7A5_9CHIR|nr:sodium/bile acid cotransporter 4 [Phyllostomus discolor]KAF6132896.1 solute carrier family 10 member 4 [Phyllostomus discolor]